MFTLVNIEYKPVKSVAEPVEAPFSFFLTLPYPHKDMYSVL